MAETSDPDASRLDLRQTLVTLRLRARQGGRRVRATALPIVLAAAAAFTAWTIAHDVFGHQVPFLAPISAWICLGFTFNRVPRKVLELGVGATIGVGVGEVVLLTAGSGGWQLAVGLLAAAVLGRLLDRGDLFTMQAGVNAMVVIGMGDALGAAGGATRLLDAVVGALVALAFSVALPGNLMVRPRRNLRGVLSELGRTLGMIADGVRKADPEILADAHAQLVGVGRILDDAASALASSSDIVRLNPALRRHRAQAAELTRILALATRLSHTVELLLRQCRGVIAEAGPSPAVAGLVDAAASGVHSLSAAVGNWHRPDHARALAVGLAEACEPSGFTEEGWRASALVSILRSVAIDLLQLTGLSRPEARRYLPETGPDDADEAHRALLPEDGASQVWGGG